MRLSRAVMAAMATPDTWGPITKSIHRKLTEALQPSVFKIFNDSSKHGGHYVKDGSAACDAGETHLKIEIVSEAFEGISLLKRQQKVYAICAQEFKDGLHSLAMKTKTAAEMGQ